MINRLCVGVFFAAIFASAIASGQTPTSKPNQPYFATPEAAVDALLEA